MFLPRKIIPMVCLFVCVQSCPVSALSRSAWKKIEVGLDSDGARHLYVFPEPDGGTIVASDKSVYYDQNQGRFRRLFSFVHAEDQINDVWGDLSRGRVLVGTGRGLYQVPLGGGPAERIFSAADQRQRICRAVIMHREFIYLGTDRGAYVRRGEKDLWRKLSRLGDSPVYQITHDNEWIYFVSGREVLAFHAETEAWQQVYARGVTTTDDDSETGVSTAAARLAVSREGVVILGTATGFLAGRPDQGWHSLHLGQPPFEDIRTILPVDRNSIVEKGVAPRFFVASERGIYVYTGRQWVAQYSGMDTTETYDLALISEGDMLAATGRGVYLRDFSNFVNEELLDIPKTNEVVDYARLKALFDSEPGIDEVHRWAIAYADVHPDKIFTWRRQARVRAWIPQLDIGVDGGRGWSRSDSLWGSSSSGGTHYVGPDDKSASRDMNWDFSLSWDLADVIWSTDQTTIDSRAKLMVELREEILNQATRLYFERRRLQIEMLSSITDFPSVVDHQLRIEELTALLDGLTGGVFSRQVKDVLKNQQEND